MHWLLVCSSRGGGGSGHNARDLCAIHEANQIYELHVIEVQVQSIGHVIIIVDLSKTASLTINLQKMKSLVLKKLYLSGIEIEPFRPVTSLSPNSSTLQVQLL